MKDVYAIVTELMNNEPLNFTEIEALAKGLIEKDISFLYRNLYDGKQILCEEWDAVIHSGSYGHTQGLLEIMGSIVKPNNGDEVEGYLTAEEILSRL
jgi:hypothetical protein